MRTCHSKDLPALMSEPERVQQDKIRTMNRPAITRTCGRAGLPELSAVLAHNSSVFGAKVMTYLSLEYESLKGGSVSFSRDQNV
jgi:hypothetical protein